MKLVYPRTCAQGNACAIAHGHREAIHNKEVSVHVEKNVGTYFTHSNGQKKVTGYSLVAGHMAKEAKHVILPEINE
jgi:hypothetical protein